VTFVIVGASAGLGRALADGFAAAGHDLLLVASDPDDIGVTAADLRIRYGREVRALALDAAEPGALGTALDAALAGVPALAGALFPIGAVDDRDDGRLDALATARLFQVNAVSVIEAVDVLWPRLEAAGGVIVGFGSVAACRGRSRNVAYSAAKSALATAFEGVRHRGAARGVRVQFYVPGYLDTSLAVGRRTPVRRGDPARLAALVLANLRRGPGVVYYPSIWRWICAGVRLLPWSVYRRLGF
jgi:short-subunit dehydrogenase